MKEPGELEKLNAVASMERTLASEKGWRWIVGLAILWTVHLEMRGQSGKPIEMAMTHLYLIVMVLYEIVMFSGRGYLRVLTSSLAALVMLGCCAGFGAILPGQVGNLRLALSFTWLTVAVIFSHESWTWFTNLKRMGTGDGAEEIAKVREWRRLLITDVSDRERIEFLGESFWTGKAKMRLLRDSNFIIAVPLPRARFFWQPAWQPELKIYEIGCTPLSYSPQEHRIRIGKSRFRNVDISVESEKLLQQFAQTVPSI
jgi:hypothetical protein